LLLLVLNCALLLAPVCRAQTPAVDLELRSIKEVRLLLTEELAQYEKTLAILVPESQRPEDSSNPAVKNLAAETMRIKRRLITITEREVTLIQQRIAFNQAAVKSTTLGEEPGSTQANGGSQNESRPLRSYTSYYSVDDEAADVARLLKLLTQYYSDLQESLHVMPSAEELAQRDAARADAASLAKIPFSADKVRLNGAEGTTALVKFSERLSDNSIPEARRDTAPILGIKTRLFGVLIASENRRESGCNPVIQPYGP
jgi:hypothetical protein